MLKTNTHNRVELLTTNGLGPRQDHEWLSMREHYSTINAEEARSIGTRLVSLVPAIGATRGG